MDETGLTAFCDRWLRSWTGNQPETLLGFYHPDAYYRDPARPDGLRGHDALRKYFTRLLAANPEWVWRVVEVLPTAKGCCLKWRAQVPTRAGMVDFNGLDIVELEGEQITRNEVYFDPRALSG